MAYLEGQLRGGIVAVGGEHTGFELTVEVDMSAIEDADTLADKAVAVSGEVFFEKLHRARSGAHTRGKTGNRKTRPELGANRAE